MTEKKMDRKRKKQRIRKKVRGSSSRPRLAVFRSSKHIYAQVIDDDAGRTVASASSLDVSAQGEESSKADTAVAVGKKLAETCKGKGIKQVVFDRGGYMYHGRIAKLAEGAREGGLEF